ncbi:RNA recognition motif-containing protein [Cyclospora cayetanensis]|uniref:Peptidyl-prolyl cis-trans isomerase n=1 Tax=Cyclospora cayetanensis TaxID=88456 RepID=A0A1D3D2F7_9EIME|nr:RNA recognition motif-containing protein [Cyclospora cayetanensis]
MAVLLQTSVGDLTIDLFVDRCPLPCYNFLALVRSKYYHNCIFHSIEKNFIARAGNPATASRAWGLGLTLNGNSANEKQTDDVGCSIWGIRHLVKSRQINLKKRARELELQRQEQQGRLSLLPASVYADVEFDMLAYQSFPEASLEGVGCTLSKSQVSDKAIGVPSCRFCPLDANPKLKHTRRGMLGMLPHAAGKAPGGTSCFYITLRPNLTQLDGKHSLFGEVVEGEDTLDRLNDAFVDSSHIPLTPVRILRAYILDDPFFCKPQRALPLASKEKENPADGECREEEEADDVAEVDAERLGFTPPASPEPLAAEALSDEETDEIMAIEKVDHKEAEARKVTLEILGDIPDADMAPPDTVLFVAKLNPVTQDSDLRLLFSRFGDVVSCDIIRDSRTGQSLQYAFVGFKKKEECEAAYFRMQNVLVDDRRSVKSIYTGNTNSSHLASTL